jgi:hypothetical protein
VHAFISTIHSGTGPIFHSLIANVQFPGFFSSTCIWNVQLKVWQYHMTVRNGDKDDYKTLFVTCDHRRPINSENHKGSLLRIVGVLCLSSGGILTRVDYAPSLN